MWSDYESGMWEVREVQPHIVKRERGTFSWVVRGDLLLGVSFCMDGSVCVWRGDFRMGVKLGR